MNKKTKKVKAWATVSGGGVLIGGGEKTYGYTPLCVYRTKVGAKAHLSPTRPKDRIIPCTITYSLPLSSKKKR